LPDEDLAFHIQIECQSLLAQNGFEQYEVSAYAREGARCRHNLNYWLFGDYVGIGAGAHGKITASLPHGVQRTEKARQPRTYLEDLAGAGAARGTGRRIGERKAVAAGDLPFEFVLNALRLNEGFALEDFESRTGLDASAVEPKLRSALARGLIEVAGARWRASGLGLRFLNDLQAGFLP
jgi:oxygen-independent coproporphyrinogen-3 oxidase